MKTSKQKQTKKMIGLSMAVLLSAALITACGSNNANTPDQNQKNNNVNNSSSAHNQQTPDNMDKNGQNGNTNNSSSQNGGSAGAGNTSSQNEGSAGAGNTSSQNEGSAGAGNSTSNNDAAGIITHTGEGTFTGQVDPHSVEITREGVSTVYQTDDRTSDAIMELGQNDKVKFEYTEKKIDSSGETVTQLLLTKIEKA